MSSNSNNYRGFGPGRGRGFGRGFGTGSGRGNNHGAGRGRGQAALTANWRNKNNTAGSTQQVPSGSSKKHAGTDVKSVENFIHKLKRIQEGKDFSDMVRRNEEQWNLCWESVDYLSPVALKYLLSNLARIPFSNVLPPPAIYSVSKAADRMFKGFKNQPSRDDTLDNVEIVINAVKKILEYFWSPHEKDTVKECIQSILCSALDFLDMRVADHRKAQKKITDVLDSLDKPWTVKTGKSRSASGLDGNDSNGDTENSVSEISSKDKPNWKQPTVGWLCDVKQFQPPHLPVMKTPEDNRSNGVYSSPEEYFDTVLPLWVAMTFCDGSNALSPKCLFKERDKVCGNVLWLTPADKVTSVRCRTNQCPNFASLICSNSRHNQGLCLSCAQKVVAKLCGPPGQNASTHLYDATVTRVDHDDQVYIHGFECRRPPPNPIHWRTSSRLAAPNLVGLVKVPGRGSPLYPQNRIIWGELKQGGKADERQNGKLVVSLLNTLDNDNEGVQFEKNDSIVIIDCQTFVPEFIPVLKVLEKQKESLLPFDNGALINVSAETSMETSRFLADCHEDARKIETDSSLSGNAVQDVMTELIDKSNMDPIVQIRGHYEERMELHTELCELVQSATLDPNQLVSFLEALYCPVHLIQGPPGTGKSYVGVVITRALLVIRRLWIKVNRSVGQPPILVLSYKNHAIDEFLCDLIKANNNNYRSLSLVRIGGSCSDPMLQRYSEQHLYSSQTFVRQARSKLIEVTDSLRRIHLVRKSATQLIGFKVDMENQENDEKEIKKASYGAATLLGNAIAYLEVILPRMTDSVRQQLLESTFNNPDQDLFSSTDDIDPILTEISSQENDITLEGYQMVGNLYEGISHHDPAIQTVEIIWRWITGFVPQPRCAFIALDVDTNQCVSIATEGSLLCSMHRCNFIQLVDSKQERCSEAIVPGKRCCRSHICSIPGCLKAGLPRPQIYCDIHACRICLERGAIARLAGDAPPRNACDQHRLCCAFDHSSKKFCCREISSAADIYCQIHRIKICEAITKKGNPCKAIAISLSFPFCKDHAEAFRLSGNPFLQVEQPCDPNNLQSIDNNNGSNGKVSCQGITTKGKPCKSTTLLPGIPYCRDHASQSSSSKGVKENVHLDALFEQHQENWPAIDALDIKDNEQADITEDTALIAAEKTDETELNDNYVNDLIDLSEETYYDVPEEKSIYDNADEMEEPESLQHLREVFMVNNEENDEEIMQIEQSLNTMMDEEKSQEPSTATTAVSSWVHPTRWTWDIAPADRWQLGQALLDVLDIIFTKIAKIVELKATAAKKDYHDAKVKANASLYEGKAVIGGTIVGCVSRLEAIMATRPFAIVVEEASEVLEPLLFACLGSSACKLELVGDHLQLKPSMMSKFDFERINRVNISLFERLICASGAHEVPSTVLSIQRRMRTGICDLTRSYYREIVTIKDHELCNTRLIGKDCVSPPTKLLSSATGGMRVPGILPQIFFWTHTGVQTRASVGLSKVNSLEAEMVCKLAKYLVKDCGVPKKSIAVLTPYKGQLMLIRKMLKTGADPLLQDWPKTNNNDSVTISTVDRFQGDEADIVIASLVTDSRSNTPFVRLVNRMIVLLSRPRIGLYIIGNFGYFEQRKVEHWDNTFDILRRPETQINDDTEDVQSDCTREEAVVSRIGPQIPLCCPQHRNIKHVVSNPDQLQLGFCPELCTHILRCSHLCNLKCHWKDLHQHNTNCKEEVDSPCVRHPQKITCEDVKSNVGYRANLSIDEMLPHYRCDTQVTVELPCMHHTSFTCADERDYVSGIKPWPKCQQEAHALYMRADCKHLVKCKCFEYQMYTQDSSLLGRCNEKVEYDPPCGHSKTVNCYMKQTYDSNSNNYVCPQQVTVNLPRCSHACTVPCKVAIELQSWTGTRCSPVGIVTEGQSIGPKDYTCSELVTFIRKCGHRVQLPCEKACNYASTKSICTEKEAIIHPDCGHECKVNCQQKQQLGTYTVPAQLTELKEGQRVSNRANHIQCDALVQLHRKCGHTATVPCSKARGIGTMGQEQCDEYVETSSPLCGHQKKIHCHVLQSRQWHPWGSNTSVSSIIKDGILSDNIDPPEKTPRELEKYFDGCKQNIYIQRTSTCGHRLKISCVEAMNYLRNKKQLPDCMEEIRLALPCGHYRNARCHEEKEFQVNPAKFSCETTIEVKCWNHDICSQTVAILCSSTSVYRCQTKSLWNCKKNHSFEIAQCYDGIPNECPTCSQEELDREITRTNSHLAEEEDISTDLTLRSIPSVFTNIPQLISGELEPKAAKIDDFCRAKASLLEKYKSRIETLPIWKRPVFCPRYTFGFVASNNPGHTDTFDPGRLANSATLNGIEIKIWSAKNLKELSASLMGKSVTLLCGFGYTCHVLVNPGQLTARGKGKKSSKTQKLLTKYHQEGYDSVLFSRDKGDSLIFWQPYALFLTHKVTLTKEVLDNICSQVERDEASQNMEDMAQSLAPKKINRVQAQPDQKRDQQTSAVRNQLRQRLKLAMANLQGTRIETIILPLQWDTETLIRSGTASLAIEQNLRQKLLFVPTTDNKKLDSAFGGAKYLRSLSKSEPFIDLELFTCLELLKLNDPGSAEDHFESYIRQSQTAGSEAHPLVLLAHARLLKVLNDGTNTLNEQKACLNAFVDMYPGAEEKWLTDDEKAMINRSTGESAHKQTSVGADADSPTKRWNELKQKHGCASKAMEDLLQLIGLKKVKVFAVEMFKTALKLKHNPEARKANLFSFNYCYMGNPGTGKTTVARLFAEILCDAGIRENRKLFECSAQKLKDDGAAEFRKLADQAKNGVIFIDEAYDLDPKNDNKGKPIVSELLTLSENKRDELSIILAGYEDDISTKLFSYNDGLQSRFHSVTFDDFDEKELRLVWQGMVEKAKFDSNSKIDNIVAKRLSKAANRKGFGNARDARKMLERAIIRAFQREADYIDERLQLIVEDVIGENPLTNPKIKEILREIDGKTGWKSIKKTVRDLIELCAKNYERELNGHAPLPVHLNRLFLGNPGTGKTTCAALFGKLLKQLNYLSNGDVVMKSASDFIAGYVGQSQTKAVEITKLARGKVLVIDEAYNLDDNLYGKQVLDVLVEKVQNSETDDMVVLLLGYEEPMLKMLRNQNPGLARRFPREYAFVFEDYNEMELLEIFNNGCKRKNVVASHMVAERAMRALSLQKSFANFGNAGAVNTLLDAAIAKASTRPQPGGVFHLLPEDIELEEDSQEDPFAPLKSLYRVDNIRNELQRLYNRFKVAESQGDPLPEIGHFVFRGSPGTGKTTVARVMAKILAQFGILASDNLVQTSGLELTGEYVGQTKKRVEEYLDRAKGSLLFIDEAYELGVGHFGQEAMTALVAAMTDPKYKGLVIIIAGYEKDIDQMLDRNVGLKSRFTRFIDFLDWETSDCLKFLESFIKKEGYNIEEVAFKQLESGFNSVRSLPGWGNARDVMKIWEMILEARADRLIGSDDVKRKIVLSDVQQAIEKMLHARKTAPGPKEPDRRIFPYPTQLPFVDNVQQQRPAQQEQQQQMEQTHWSEEQDKALKPESQEESDENASDDDDDDDDEDVQRDAGVPDDQWEELKQAKLKQKRDSKKKKDEERQKEIRRRQETMENIRRICPCPMGYQWFKVGGGWRCAGGAHYVSDEQLQRMYTRSD